VRGPAPTAYAGDGVEDPIVEAPIPPEPIAKKPSANRIAPSTRKIRVAIGTTDEVRSFTSWRRSGLMFR